MRPRAAPPCRPRARCSVSTLCRVCVRAAAAAARSGKCSAVYTFGHHPVYSGGPNGDTPSLLSELAPLLTSSGVLGYFNGHDHDMQARTRARMWGVWVHRRVVVCVGGGGAR